MRAPVAQLDRASASGVEGRGFESRRVYHFFVPFPRIVSNLVKSLIYHIFFNVKFFTGLKIRA